MGMYLEEEACDETREVQRTRHANCETDDDVQTRPSEDRPQNRGGQSAERHADTNLVGTLGHNIADDSVNADASDDDGNHSEEPEEQHVEPSEWALLSETTRLTAAEARRFESTTRGQETVRLPRSWPRP
jgi:hypothetical protein